MDALTPGTDLGYIFGGIAAEVPNNGNTTASPELFAVTYNPVPEASPLNLFTVFGVVMTLIYSLGFNTSKLASAFSVW